MKALHVCCFCILAILYGTFSIRCNDNLSRTSFSLNPILKDKILYHLHHHSVIEIYVTTENDHLTIETTCNWLW